MKNIFKVLGRMFGKKKNIHPSVPSPFITGYHFIRFINLPDVFRDIPIKVIERDDSGNAFISKRDVNISQFLSSMCFSVDIDYNRKTIELTFLETDGASILGIFDNFISYQENNETKGLCDMYFYLTDVTGQVVVIASKFSKVKVSDTRRSFLNQYGSSNNCENSVLKSKLTLSFEVFHMSPSVLIECQDFHDKEYRNDKEDCTKNESIYQRFLLWLKNIFKG